MTKLSQRYLSDVKAFFPVTGKPERAYLTKLSEQIEDYCIEKKVTMIEEIYDGFGHPSEVASTYFTGIDTPNLIKRIQLTKWVKRGIVALLLIALTAVGIYAVDSYKAYEVFKQDAIFFEETEITD